MTALYDCVEFIFVNIVKYSQYLQYKDGITYFLIKIVQNGRLFKGQKHTIKSFLIYTCYYWSR